MCCGYVNIAPFNDSLIGQKRKQAAETLFVVLSDKLFEIVLCMVGAPIEDRFSPSTLHRISRYFLYKSCAPIAYTLLALGCFI